MNCKKHLPTGLILLLVGSTAIADTTVNQLLKSRFSGAGKIINVFAGKAAKKGLAIQTAVSGDRQATKTGRDIQVIDLGEEMIWRYSVKRSGKVKKCRATTFDEFREQLAAFDELPFFGGGEQAGEPLDDGPQPVGYEVSSSFEKTGEQETHAGVTGDVFRFEAIAHHPGMSVDAGGGVLETIFVVGPKTDAWIEMQAWNKRWAAVIGEMSGMGKKLNRLLATNPALQKAMTELQSKKSELDGTLLRVNTRLSTVRDSLAQEQAQTENNDADETPTSIGGFGAKLGSSLFNKNREDSVAEGPKELYMNELKITGLSDSADPILTLPNKCTK